MRPCPQKVQCEVLGISEICKRKTTTTKIEKYLLDVTKIVLWKE